MWDKRTSRQYFVHAQCSQHGHADSQIFSVNLRSEKSSKMFKTCISWEFRAFLSKNCSKCFFVFEWSNCFDTCFTHAQSCANVRVQSATQCTASVHLLHMPRFCDWNTENSAWKIGPVSSHSDTSFVKKGKPNVEETDSMSFSFWCLVWTHESWWFITVTCNSCTLELSFRTLIEPYIDHIAFTILSTWSCAFLASSHPLCCPKTVEPPRLWMDFLTVWPWKRRGNNPVSTEPWLLEAYLREKNHEKSRPSRTCVRRKKKIQIQRVGMQFLPFHGRRSFTENNSLKNTCSSKLPPLLHIPLKVPKNATNHSLSTALKKSLLDL